jgi:hypothetical protein
MSHSQQSLHWRQRSQRWIGQASLVQETQILVASCSQMLHGKGMGKWSYFFLEVPCEGAAGAWRDRNPRQRCAS